MKHIAIIGNGVSGVTAARHIRKLSNHKITLISSETEHFFSRTALMYVYMGHMKYENIKPYEDHFWKKNSIDLLKAYVEKVNSDEKVLDLKGGGNFPYDELIIACGSKPNKFGWKGQDLAGVQGLYSWQDLEMMEKNTQNIKKAVIVGGGLIGVEMAEMLLSRGIEVTFLVREQHFWGNILPKEEGELIARHIRKHGVDLRFKTELDQILADQEGKATAVKTKSGEKIDCQFVGLTAGVSPNIDFLKNSRVEINRGVLVDQYLKTNIDGVYAIGDCAEFKEHPTGRKNIEQVWYTGKMMGETVAQTICKEPLAYKPGVWFNSAKFFDIEYQTYGWVWPEPKENEAVFYWEHQDGEKCLKFIFDKDDRTFLALNAFGVRIRHQTVDRWIKNRFKIDQVISELGKANFDPEFYAKFESEVQQKFNQTEAIKA